MLRRRFLMFFAVTAFALSIAACTTQSWVTPLAPYRPGRGVDCHVILTAGPAPAGTENLAIVRCNDGGLQGDACIKRVREDACIVGGDVVYGLHWEYERTASLVGTIGVAPRAEHAPL